MIRALTSDWSGAGTRDRTAASMCASGSAADVVTIAVQVMGKLRGAIDMPPNAPEADVLAAAEAVPNVVQMLAGKRIVKRIHVPNRIVNFVVAG